MRGDALDRIEKGVARTGACAGDAALDHSAHRVAVALCGGDRTAETCGIGLAAHLREAGFETDVGKAFFRHDTRSDQCRREAAREVAPAAGIVPSVPFDPCRAVGMGGAPVVGERGVIGRACVGIGEANGQWRSGGVPFPEARDDLRQVRFAARGGAGRASAPAGEIRFEVGGAERDAGRQAVDRDADLRAVRFAPDGEAETMSERIHAQHRIFSRSAKNPG